MRTGFSSQTRNILNRLQESKEFNCYCLGHNYYSINLVPPITFEDGEKINFTLIGSGKTKYAIDKIPHIIKKYKIDIFGGLLDSLPEDRTLVIKDKKGDIQILTFKELWDKYNSNLDGVQTLSVKLNIGKERNWVTKHPTNDKKYFHKFIKKEVVGVWTPILNIARRYVDDYKLYRINSKYGETEVSSKHSLLYINKDKIKKITPLDLFEQKQSLVKINRFEFQRRSSIYYTSSRDSYNIHFCKFIGAYLSEGCLNHFKHKSGNNWSIIISNTDKKWLDDIRKSGEVILGKRGSYSKSDDCYNLVFYGKDKFEWLEKLCGKGSRNKKLPTNLFHFSPNLQKLFLYTLIKGDGHIYKTIMNLRLYRKIKKFGYTSNSRKLITGLSFLLTRMRIRHSIFYRKDNDSYSIFSAAYQHKKIVNKISIRNYNGYIYDITTKNETFVDGLGLIGVHNTFMLLEGGFMNCDTSPTKTFWYYPSDGGGGLPTGCDNILRKVNMPIAMSKFAQMQIKKVHNIDSEYIPHGVDTTLFYPLSSEQKKMDRNKWLLRDKFVVGVVARNQGRKMLDRTIKAFALFAKDKEDARLLMHCDPNDAAQAFSLYELIRRYKIRNKVIFTDVSFYNPYSYKQMNGVYNLMDVFFLSTCIHPDIDVTTNQGPVPIKNIKVGDRILTSKGVYRRVEQVIPSMKKCKMLTIKADGLPELKVTPNHRIYTKKCSGSIDKKKSIIRNIEIVQASELKKFDYLIHPIPKTTENKKTIITKQYIKEGRNQFGSVFRHKHVNSLPKEIVLDYNFGLVCGYYLSEGISNEDGLGFCFHTKEIDKYSLVEMILNNRFVTKTRIHHDTRNRTVFWATGAQLGRLMGDLFGKGAHNKKLPEWILDSPKEFRKGLIEGLWKGDGCLWISRKSSKVFELQTVSKSMAHQVFNLLLAEGFRPTLSKTQRNSVVWKLKVTGNQNFGSFCGINESLVQNDKSRIWTDRINVYYPIRSIIENNYEGEVFDLTVEEEHNYICHCLVKNSGEGFGIPCVTPNTKIVTNEGIKDIKDIKKGDKVLTHKNRFCKVNKVMKKKVNEKILRIYPYGSLPIEITKEHPIYSIKKPKAKWKKSSTDILIKSEPEWNSSISLKKGDSVILSNLPIIYKAVTFDLINFDKNILYDKNYVWYKMGYSPKHKNIPKKYKRIVNLNEDLARCLGYYIAEGSVIKNNMSTIEFSCGFNIKEMNRTIKTMKEIFGIEPSIYGTKYKSLVYSSRILAKFFSDICGVGAFNKKIPKEIYFGNNNIRNFFLQGYWEGDGSQNKNRKTLTTLSPILTHQLITLLPTIKKRNTIVLGKDNCYGISFKDTFDKTHSNKQWILNNINGIAKSIRKIEEINYEGYVYNLEVDEDNTYVTTSFTVHNCIEAMACGIPQICTDYTTTRELVLEDGQSGEAVKLVGEESDTPFPHTDEILDGTLTGTYEVERGMMSIYNAVNILNKLYNDRSLLEKYSKTSIEKAKKYYSWQVIMPKWIEILRRLSE